MLYIHSYDAADLNLHVINTKTAKLELRRIYIAFMYETYQCRFLRDSEETGCSLFRAQYRLCTCVHFESSECGMILHIYLSVFDFLYKLLHCCDTARDPCCFIDMQEHKHCQNIIL